MLQTEVAESKSQDTYAHCMGIFFACSASKYRRPGCDIDKEIR